MCLRENTGSLFIYRDPFVSKPRCCSCFVRFFFVPDLSPPKTPFSAAGSSFLHPDLRVPVFFFRSSPSVLDPLLRVNPSTFSFYFVLLLPRAFRLRASGRAPPAPIFFFVLGQTQGHSSRARTVHSVPSCCSKLTRAHASGRPAPPPAFLPRSGLEPANAALAPSAISLSPNGI